MVAVARLVVAAPAAGTERGTAPFWSPDGRSIGFFADNQLKRLDIDGGSIKTVMSTIPAQGGADVGRRRYSLSFQRVPASPCSALPPRAVNHLPRHGSGCFESGLTRNRFSRMAVISSST